MELVSTMEISGEEREIADAYARGRIEGINESLSGIGKAKNLLSVSQYTTRTQNGITITNNGDGTFTANGTATEYATFRVVIGLSNLKNGKTYKLVGSPISATFRKRSMIYNRTDGAVVCQDLGEGATFVNNTAKQFEYIIDFQKDETVSNMVFKPMITPNLSATYDDFTVYCGDNETLTEDVASLKNDLDKYKPKEYYGKSLTMPTDGSYLVTASAMGYSVMVCTYAVYVLDGAIRYIEQVASKDLTLSFSGNVITPSYTANNIYFYVLQIGNIWS